METASPSKAMLLNETVNHAIAALEVAEMLPAGREDYVRKLEAWSLGRSDLRFVRECILRFRDGSDEEKREWLFEARRQATNPRIHLLFSKALQQGLGAPIAAWIERVLETDLPQANAPVKIPFPDQDTDAKILTIASWDQRRRAEARGCLTALLADPGSDPRVKAAGLRAAKDAGIANGILDR